MQGQQQANVTLTVDIAVLQIAKGQPSCLQVLLIKRGKDPYKGMWALPGGKLDADDLNLYDAACRELREETGLDVPYCFQVQTFGDRERDPRGRYISVLYVVPPLPPLRSDVIAGDDACDAQWFSLTELPALAFDHQHLIDAAVEYLSW